MAEMFDGLDVFEQRALIDQLALLPSHIDQLVADGLLKAEIADNRSMLAGGR